MVNHLNRGQHKSDQADYRELALVYPLGHKRRFCKSPLVTGIVAMLVEYVVLLVDKIIVGQMIGEKGLSAITLTTPYFMLIVFFNMLLVTGTSLSMNKEIGRLHEKRANELFSNGVIWSLILGAFLTAGAIFIKPFILHTEDVSPAVYELASSYYNGLIPLPLVMLLNNILYECITNVGNERLCLISSAVQVISNIGLAIFLGLSMGILGVAVSMTVSTLLALVVLLFHFRRADNTLKLIYSVSFRDFLSCCRFGFFDASTYLYEVFFTLIMNAFILRELGESWLAVFCVVISVQELMTAVLDGASTALQPFVSIYEGENNPGGIRRIMSIAEKGSAIVGTALAILVILCANLLVWLLGITDPLVVHRCTIAIRIVSLSSFFMGLLTTFSSYYLCCGKILLASFCRFALSLSELILAVLVGLLFGANGIWAGIAAAPLIAMFLTGLILNRRSGSNQFSFLLDNKDYESWKCFDAESSSKSVMAITNDVEEFLHEKNVDNRDCLKARLLVEETGMMIAELNQKKIARIECCVYAGKDQIRVILRDDGVHTNLTDDDRAVGSMNGYLSSRIISLYEMKSYLKATSFNRSVYTIPRKQTDAALS